MPNDASNDMTKDGAPGQASAVHEEPAACAPGAAGGSAAPTPPQSPQSPGVAETSEPAEPPTREDVRRFRLATLRARLALLGVAFDPSTDEATLRRMLRAAEGQGDRAARPGLKDVKGVPGSPDTPDTAGATGAASMIDTTDTTGHAPDPAPAAEPDLPPSAAMRRATARHLRERQRVAAEDTGVSGVTGSPRTGGGRPRGRGRS